MELIFASKDSIKIRTKLSTFIIDPSEKSDGDVLVFICKKCGKEKQ